MKIGFIGAGYVGLITATVLAYKNPNHKFYVVDTLKSKIEALKNGNHYIKELGFKEIFDKVFNIQSSTDIESSTKDDIESNLSKVNKEQPSNDDIESNLSKDILKEDEKTSEITKDTVDMLIDRKYNNLIVSNDYDSLKDSDIIFIAVCTPDNDGVCNLTYFNKAIKKVDEFVTENTIIIVKSTVPIGTTKNIHFKNNASVFNIPEFLAEGTAIQDLLNPIRILIGSSLNNDFNTVSNKIEKIKSLFNYVDNNLIVTTDSNTSELIKLASNFLLASRVAHINLLESIAEQYDANINDISKILRMDERIGNKFLNPSIAFGGSCFRKDINNLSSICKDDIFSKYVKSINTINEHHVFILYNMLKAELSDINKAQYSKDDVKEPSKDNLIKLNESQSLSKTKDNLISFNKTNNKILILGYGFKNNTEDTRESPTQMFIDLIKNDFEYECYDIHIDKYFKQYNINDFDIFVLMNNEVQYIEIINKIIKDRFDDNEQNDIIKNNNKLIIKNNKCIILNPRHTKLLC